MGSKYQRYQPRHNEDGKEHYRVHPIWRGIGFSMIVLFPIIAYAGMKILLTLDWFPIPADLLAKQSHFLYKLIPDQLIYIKLLTMLVIILALTAIFTLFSFFVNSAFGVSKRNDPFYVPPVKRQRQRRK